ncbi:MAG: hypothetical protein KGL59_05110 [Acidobacteriota bacterium]|nr:hypothetical protein [Acidobacteriota bacterium]
MLHDADRMFTGQILYRDFFEQTFPGVQILFLALFKLFGRRTWIPNATLVFLGIGFTLLLFAVSKKILSDRRAPLPALAFLTLIFHERFDATHHWFSILAILGAVALMMDRGSNSRVFFAGVLLGLSTCFTQSHGSLALVAFALFMWLERDSREDYRRIFGFYAILLAGYALPLLLIAGPFILRAGWARFIDCTFIYPFRYGPSLRIGNDWRGYMIGLPAVVRSLRPWRIATFVLVHALVPLIYILALLRYALGTLCESAILRSRLLLIALVGLFLFLSVASSPNWNRLYYVCFPGLLLFCWWLEQTGRQGQWLLGAIYLTSMGLMLASPISTQLRRHEFLSLPGGRTAFLERKNFSRYEWVSAQTHPDDYFFGGFYPDFYFLLELRNPAPVPYVSADDSTRPEAVAETVRGLALHRVQLILWADRLDLPPVPARDHLGPLRDYIRRHYHVVKNFTRYQEWSRNEEQAIPAADRVSGIAPGPLARLGQKGRLP